MCDCHDIMDEKLKERTGDPEAEMACAFLFGVKTISVPYIEFYYRKKKKSGEFMPKKHSGSLLPSFCPFCGKSYKSKHEGVILT